MTPMERVRAGLQGRDLRWFDWLVARFPAKCLGEYHPDHDDSPPLFVRWALFKRPWGQVLVHLFLREDNRQLGVHTHPWNFASIVLRGTYFEEGPWGWRRRSPGSIGMHRARFAHVQYAGLWPCWTICVTGRRKENWGFPSAGVKDIPSVAYSKENS